MSFSQHSLGHRGTSTGSKVIENSKEVQIIIAQSLTVVRLSSY